MNQYEILYSEILAHAIKRILTDKPRFTRFFRGFFYCSGDNLLSYCIQYLVLLLTFYISILLKFYIDKDLYNLDY